MDEGVVFHDEQARGGGHSRILSCWFAVSTPCTVTEGDRNPIPKLMIMPEGVG